MLVQLHPNNETYIEHEVPHMPDVIGAIFDAREMETGGHIVAALLALPADVREVVSRVLSKCS